MCYHLPDLPAGHGAVALSSFSCDDGLGRELVETNSRPLIVSMAILLIEFKSAASQLTPCFTIIFAVKSSRIIIITLKVKLMMLARQLGEEKVPLKFISR